MSQAVLADAQFGLARVLRPYENFAYGATPTTNTALVAVVPTGGITITPGDSFVLELIPEFGAVLATATNTPYRVVAIAGYGLYVFSSYDSMTQQATFYAPIPFGDESPFASNYSGAIAEGTELSITRPGGYNGYPGSVPIMFSEGGMPLDDMAGRNGYSRTLVRGVQVPMGARVLVWLPRLVLLPNELVPLPEQQSMYQWEFSFRIRNLTDFNSLRSPYHLASGRAGAASFPDEGEVPGTSEVRVPVPASDHSVIFNGVEPPNSPLARVVTERMLKEGFQTRSGRDLLPLIPGKFGVLGGNHAEVAGVGFVEGPGQYQQGIVSNLSPWPPGPVTGWSDEYYGNGAYAPLFSILEIQCPGDEMLVSLTKVSGETANWAFPRTSESDPLTPGEDLPIVQAFSQGYEYMGVYVMPGSAP